MQFHPFVSCVHPARVVNPYTKDVCYVPCGKCSICKETRATSWQMRITDETKSHKYAYSFELSYDDEHLPVLRRVKDAFINIEDDIAITTEHLSTFGFADYQFVKGRAKMPYLSRKRPTDFLKRLRIYLKRCPEVKNPYIRYYYVGEYGPQYYRPHYHFLLWFEDDFIAGHIREILFANWSYGDIRAIEPVHKNHAHYLARYVTGITDLPKFYQIQEITQFQRSSRKPPLGTLPLYSREVCEMFHNENFRVTRQKQNQYVSDIIPRIYSDRLFPTLPLLADATARCRSEIYQYPLRFSTYQEFFEACRSFSTAFVTPPSDVIYRYSTALYERAYDAQRRRYGDNSSLFPWHCFRHWYSVSHRVSALAGIYGVSIPRYVGRIYDFYRVKNYENLKKQLDYEQRPHLDRLPEMLNIDYDFFLRLRDSKVPWSELSASEQMILETFGVYEDLYNSDYLYDVDLYNTGSYKTIVEYQNFIAKHRVKSRLNRELMDKRLKDPRYRTEIMYHFNKKDYVYDYVRSLADGHHIIESYISKNG